MLRFVSRTLLLTTASACLSVAAYAQEQSAAEDEGNEENTEVATEANSSGERTLLQRLTFFGDRQGRDPRKTPANITVVTGEELADRFDNDMQEIVRYEPGITVNRQTSGTDPFNTFGGFNIRGVGGNRIQMLVDGSRVPERIIDGTRDYLDFNFTKQVDLVRGPGSVLWGADALGGIVALETIDPEDILEERMRGGTATTSFDSLDNEFNNALTYAQRVTPDLAVLGGISYAHADEAEFRNARADGGIYGCPRNITYGATPCNALDPTDKSTYRGLAKAVYTPGVDHRIELSADFMRRRTDVDYDHVLGPVYSSFSGAPTGEIVNDYDRRLDLYRGRFAVEHDWEIGSAFIDDLRWTLSYSPHGYERTGLRDSTSATGDRILRRDFLSYSEDFLELDVQLTSRFATGPLDHVVTWGFDGDVTTTDYERVDTTTNLTTGTVTEARAGGFNFANATTKRADFYIQDQVSLFDGRVEITPGMRFAHYDIDPRPNADYQPVPGAEPRRSVENRVLASLGVTVELNDYLSAYGAFNQGFKMPTAQQLYTSLPGTFFDLIPAPDLKPEEVNNYEVGLRGEFDRGFVSINGFYAEYTNFIESFYNPPGTNDYTYRNLSFVTIWGIEASGEVELTEQLTADFSVAWQKGRQRASATAMETPHTVPPLTAVVGLSYEIPQHNVALDAIGTFAAAVKETSSPNNFKPDGYALLDLFARWMPTENAELRVGVKNVFDTRYFLPSAASYNWTASHSVAVTNPIELQTGAGRSYMASFSVKF